MNPVLLSFVDEYSDSFVPLYERGVLPKPLSLLYQDKNFTCFTDLLKVCEQVYQHTTITAEQVKMVKEKTREQSNSKLWFQQRVGRITASKLRNVLHTSISNPSKSLLTSICYPEMVRYQSKACLYGCKHEDDARKAYTEVMSTRHRSFSVARSGLVLDMSRPFIGASPDGLVQCCCCGKGTLEIKCPYSCRDKAFEEASKDKSFYLQCNDKGDLLLTKDHVYYHQVQMQMEVCQTEYCDFVVWSKDQLLCQRVLYDKEFIKAKLDSLGEFTTKCILPELIAKWFTKPELSTNDESTSDVDPPLDNSSDGDVSATSVNSTDLVN